MKKEVTVVTPEREHLRAIKREASRRCRARQKMIANEERIPAELMVRSAQPKSMLMENYKMQIGDAFIRLNKNGGKKVALTITENGKTGRKSFKDMKTAIQAFRNKVAEMA